MSGYKLTYFDAYGRAEVARWLFILAGVPYEDNRLTDQQWEALKPSAPFRQIPLLEAEGKTLCQTNAITRYLANKFGFAGKTDIEKAEVDMIVECTMEIISPLGYIEDQAPKDKKADLLSEFARDLMRKFLGYLQELLHKNNNGDGFFVGQTVTLADIMMVHADYWLDYCKLTQVLDEYPKLKSHRERIQSLPAIADWIKKRPVTPF